MLTVRTLQQQSSTSFLLCNYNFNDIVNVEVKSQAADKFKRRKENTKIASANDTSPKNMSHDKQLRAEAMEGVISQHPEHGATGKKKEAINAIDVSICPQSQTFAEPSASTYVGHEVVESDEDPDLCLIEITHLSRKDELGEDGTADESIAKEKRDVEAKELSGSSSNSSGDSDDDMSDMEVEVGGFDLDDILEAERVVGVDEGEQDSDIVRRYERGTYFGGSTVASRDRHKDAANRAEPTRHLPSSLEIPRPRSPLPFFDAPEDDDVQQAARFFEVSQIPKINGVDVRMVETLPTDAELGLYSDQVYQRWRVRYLSHLRKCWMPVETWSV
jgi:hypothetical protein